MNSIRSAIKMTGEQFSRQGVRRYLFNSGWLFAEQGLRMIAGFLVGIYVARHLGPAQFGTFSYVIAFVALFAPLASLGLDSIVIRELVVHRKDEAAILGTAFRLKAVGALIALAALALTLTIVGVVAPIRGYVFVVGIGLLAQAFDVTDLHFQSHVLSKYASLCRMFQIALSAGLKLALVWNGAGLEWFVAVALIDQLALAAALAWAYRQRGGERFYATFDRGLARRLVSASSPLIISGLIGALYMRIDQVLIMALVGAEGVGLYAAATVLTEALFFVPAVVSSTLFPAIVAAGAGDVATYAARRVMLYRALLGGTLVMSMTVALAAPLIVRILYGERFAAAALVLSIHAFTLPFVACALVFGKVLIAEGRHALMPKITLAALVANVGGLVLLLPAVGVAGAAAAAVLAQATALGTLLVLDRDSRVDARHVLGIAVPVRAR